MQKDTRAMESKSSTIDEKKENWENTHALHDRYYELEQIHGIQGARIATESHTAAINLIDSIVNEEFFSLMLIMNILYQILIISVT